MKKIEILVFIFFATLPLYLTDDFRMSFSGITLTINFILLLFVFITFFIYKINFSIDKKSLPIFLILIILILLHFFGYRTNINTYDYFKYIIKFLSVFIAFFFSYQFSRKIINSNNKLNNYLLIFIISSSFFIGYLILYYLSLKSLFLGNKFFNTELTRYGKNQLQIYLAITTPIIIYLFNKFNNFFIKFIIIFSLLIHSFAIIYVGSRGLWVSFGFILFIFIIFALFKTFLTMKIKKLYLINTIFIIIFGLILLNNVKIFETEHVLKKINTLFYFFEHGSSGIDVSASERSFLISFSLEKLQEKPINLIIGYGLGAFKFLNPFHKLTHNDYVFFLFDFGIFGLFFFLLLEIYIIIELKKRDFPLYLFLPFYFDLFFINAYNFLLFWIIIGLFLGIRKEAKY